MNHEMIHHGQRDKAKARRLPLLRSGLFLTTLLLLVCLPAGAAYERIDKHGSDDPLHAAIYRLDNGLEVHITENHDTPRFYAEIAVRAGSKNDPPETTGLAHYFEHLMFKGTPRMGTLDYEKEKVHLDRITELYEQHFREQDAEKRKEIYKQIDAEAQLAAQYAVPNEIDRVYNEMGATNLNAHTWVEETVYEVNLPANRFPQWVAVESDRFTHPVFRLFPTELETVYEEKNTSLDNKFRLIEEAVDKALYQKHPYGQWPTLGNIEDLKRPSIKNIQHFFETWYVPNNMALFLSGDLNTDETIRLIDQAFSRWTAKPLPKQKHWKEPRIKGRKTVTVNYEGEEYVLLAFRTAARNHKDADALRLLDMILSNSVAGLIDLDLVQQQKVRQAGASPMLFNDYGVEYLFGVPKKGQSLEEVEKLLLEQLERLKKGEFEDWILPAIINDFKKNKKSELESNESRVGMMTSAWLGYEPWDHAVTQIARMEKITKEQLVQVAKKYFGDDYIAGYRRDAQHAVVHVEKPPITPVNIDPTRQSAFGAEILAMPCVPIEPKFVVPDKDFKTVEDPNGVTVYYAPNPINDVFTFSLSVDFGNWEDNTIGTAVQLLQKSGTERFSAQQLKKEWYKLGTDFGMGVGDNETTITLRGLDANFEASLALLAEVLTRPAGDAATLDELKKIILAQRADEKKQAQSIASALIQYHRFGNDSYYLRRLPDAAVQQLEVDKLFASIKKLLTYKHTISYAGSLPLESVLAAVKKSDPVTGPLQDTPPYRYLKARAPEQNEVYLFDKESNQAIVRLEFGCGEYNESLAPEEELFNEYFSGGMAGIVFQELREARALAYMAAARYAPGYRAKDQDLMLGVIQTQNDKVADAVEGFVQLLDSVPVSEERFAAAKTAAINQYRTGKIGFREVLGAVQAWKRHELPVDPRVARYAGIQAGTLDKVLAFHKAFLAGRPKLISVVGTKAKMNMDALKKSGTLREITVDDIFAK